MAAALRAAEETLTARILARITAEGVERIIALVAGAERVNGQIALRVPRDVIKAKCEPYLVRGKPAKRTELTNGSDHAIVAAFGAVYRGIVQYYLLAGDVFRLHRLQWVMERPVAASVHHPLAGRCHFGHSDV